MMKPNPGDINEKPIFFDVDSTLVMHNTDNFGDFLEIEDPNTGKIKRVRKHSPHIELIKSYSARGWYVVVWSGSGGALANVVVDALELRPYIDLVMGKPLLYVDDKDVSEWMCSRIYLEMDNG
jgi:hypothetical protein